MNGNWYIIVNGKGQNTQNMSGGKEVKYSAITDSHFKLHAQVGIDSDHGITVSSGEYMLYPEFLTVAMITNAGGIND